MDRCINCDTLLNGPICHQCGQSIRPNRWSTNELFHLFVAQLTNIEKGFWYTAIALIQSPGKLIQDYWKGRTIYTYNPFRYVIILTAINLLITFWLGIDDMLQDSIQPENVTEQFGEDTIASADQKFDTWLNALVLLLIPFFALITKWLFASAGKNYAEHLILNAFIMGQQSLITSCTHFIFYLFPGLFVIYLPFNFVVGLVYNAFVFHRLFSVYWMNAVLKALVLGMVGIFVFLGLITVASGIAIALS